MYLWRQDLGLEVVKNNRYLSSSSDTIDRYVGLIEYTFGDLSTCTEETREYGYKIQDLIVNGSSLSLDGMEWFMNATNDWMMTRKRYALEKEIKSTVAEN